MPIAFKEWAVTVRALAEGEQLLTLRKGGIREENKHFELEHERFFLYPTFDHQRNDLVRESHHPELRRALEEGVWPDEEPPPKALIQDGGIPQPDRVRLRAWAEVTDHVTIEDRRTLDNWGNERIERKLQAAGVATDLISAALHGATESGDEPASQFDAALSTLRHRFRTPPETEKDRNRALGFLVRKGYELETAYDAIRAYGRD